jgi:hypothetical protein
MTARDDGMFGRHDNFGSSSIVMPSAYPVRNGMSRADLVAIEPAPYENAQPVGQALRVRGNGRDERSDVHAYQLLYSIMPAAGMLVGVA